MLPIRHPTNEIHQALITAQEETAPPAQTPAYAPSADTHRTYSAPIWKTSPYFCFPRFCSEGAIAWLNANSGITPPIREQYIRITRRWQFWIAVRKWTLTSVRDYPNTMRILIQEACYLFNRPLYKQLDGYVCGSHWTRIPTKRTPSIIATLDGYVCGSHWTRKR